MKIVIKNIIGLAFLPCLPLMPVHKEVLLCHKKHHTLAHTLDARTLQPSVIALSIKLSLPASIRSFVIQLPSLVTVVSGDVIVTDTFLGIRFVNVVNKKDV